MRGELYRHKKGTVYRELERRVAMWPHAAESLFILVTDRTLTPRATDDIRAGEEYVVYENAETGDCWARPARLFDEFERFTPLVPRWECFEDAAYYDLWAVRPVGERGWGVNTFHLRTRQEAEGLVALLSLHRSTYVSLLEGGHTVLADRHAYAAETLLGYERKAEG